MKINEVFTRKWHHDLGAEPERPPIPNLAAPIDAAVAFNVADDDATARREHRKGRRQDQNSEAHT